jgi:hypothetical protein
VVFDLSFLCPDARNTKLLESVPAGTIAWRWAGAACIPLHDEINGAVEGIGLSQPCSRGQILLKA